MKHFWEILQLDRPLAVVDVGAAHIDTAPPYHCLQQDGKCTVIGFEPQTELWPPQTENTRTLPYVIGNGYSAMLHVCDAPGMTSLYQPNKVVLDAFCAKSAGGDKWGDVIKTIDVTTRRLDHIDEVEQIDFLKVDAEASEVDIIYGAARKLDNAVCVHTEVCFVPLYVGQPLFRDIDAVLYKLGFMFHSFAAISTRTITPYRTAGAPMNQAVQADVVYMRDFTKLDALSEGQLKRMAIIAGDCYGSIDLAFRCVTELVKRGCMPEAILSSECFKPKTENAWWSER